MARLFTDQLQRFTFSNFANRFWDAKTFFKVLKNCKKL